MFSRSLSLTTLSCLLLLSGTGCSPLSAILQNQTSDSLEAALSDVVEEAQAAVNNTSAESAGEIDPDAEATTGQDNSLKAAAEASSQAEAAAKTAVTQSDWGQVSGAWNQAIAHASAVPEDSPSYGEARAQIARYQASQAQANQAYQAAMAVRYQSLTTSPINDAPKAGSLEAEGRKLRKHLQKKEFAQVNTMLRSAISANRRTEVGTYYADAVLMNAFAGNDVVYMPELMTQLNKWVEAEPENATAYAVRAYFTQAPIWPELRIVRPDSANTRPDASAQQLLVSLIDAEIALELEPKHPLAHLAKLRMAKVVSLWGEERDETIFEEAFTAANAVLPNSFEVIQEKAFYLFFENNNGEAALAYLRPLAASAPANSAVPMLIPFIHTAVSLSRNIEQEYMQRPEVWAEVQQHAERVIAGLPETGLYAAWYARMASNAHRSDIASKYKQIAMNKGSESPMVQVYLRMML